jgi:hypothetical protein
MLCAGLLAATLTGVTTTGAATGADIPGLQGSRLVQPESAITAAGVLAGRRPGRNEPAARASWAASVPPIGVLIDHMAVGGRAAAAGEPVAPEPEIVLASAETADGAAPVAAPARLEVEAVSQSSAGDRGGADRGQSKRKANDPCADQADECRDALRQLRDDDIAGIGLDIRVGGRPGSDYPCECRLDGETYKPRRFATTTFTWKAAGYCHKPLYFEDWQLERYGHSHGYLDPVFSGAHFFVTLTVLPYKMGVELPWECVYPLGYYRPGSCAPWTVPAVPISCRGFAVQGATVTGLVFLLP